MNVNTYNATSFHDARISIPKTSPSRVLRDGQWTPGNSWEWFEVLPGVFYLDGSWEKARHQAEQSPEFGRSEDYIQKRYRIVADVTDQHE
jgi:hypothetical protein